MSDEREDSGLPYGIRGEQNASQRRDEKPNEVEQSQGIPVADVGGNLEG